MQPKRPAGVTVIAIIGIIYSSLFSLTCPLCAGLAVMVMYPQLDKMAQKDPEFVEVKQMLDTFVNNPTLKAYFIASFAITIIMGLWLLFSSIGLLKLRPWARKACLVYAVVAILFQVGSFVVSLTLVNPEVEKWQKEVMAKKGQPAPPSNPVLDSMMGFGGMLIPIAFSIAILIVLNSATSKAAFAQQGIDSYEDQRYGDDYGMERRSYDEYDQPPDEDYDRPPDDYGRREDDYDRP